MNSATTGGTSAIELIGSRKSCEPLLSAAGDGGLVYYGIESQVADEWEEGLGIVHAGAPPTLERVAAIASSNGDALVDFTTGQKLVFITSPSIVQAAAHLHKTAARVAVTTNVAIASALAAGNSADGVTLAAGNRVFLGGQTDPAENGLWLAPASGAATRPLDFYTGDAARGAIVSILEGSRAGETFVCTATAAAVIGTDDLTWVSAFSAWTGSTSITTLGTITTGVWNGTAVPVAHGGTGATSASSARSNLGVTATGADTTYAYRANNLSDLANVATARSNLGVTATGADTTYAYRASNLSDLANVATARSNLGVTATGADTTYAYRANNLSDLANAGTARSNLGLAIGSDVQAYNASLAAIAAGTWAGATSITTLGTITAGVWNGTAVPVAHGGTGATSASSARSNLGAAATGAATASGLTMSTARILGRTTASTGAIEEIAIGSNLSLTSGILSTISNVSASLTSVDNGIVLWSGTSGQILKQASGSGIIKATSGVYGTANAGTDYYAPGSTDVAVADGGTGASNAASAATNLGLGTGDNVTHLTVTGAENSGGSGNGGLVATTVNAGGNAGIRLASGGTNRFQIGCIGSAGSTAMRFYVYEDSAEGMRLDRTRNLVIGSTITPTAGANCLAFGIAGTALTPHSSQCGLYGETISSTSELRAVDGAANRITLTPHPPEVLDTHVERLKAAGLDPVLVPWGYRSSNDFLGIETFADIAAGLRCVEWLMKEAGRPVSLVWERPLAGGPVLTWDERQEQTAVKWQREADAHDHALDRWAAQPFWLRDTVSRRPVSVGSRPEDPAPPKWLADRLAHSKA